MSEPNNAEISRSIGDNSADIIEDDAVAFCAATGTALQPDFAQHQGQVGHRGRQIHLVFRLDPTEVAGLPDAQLDQPGQPVFCHHSACSILVVGSALLQRSGLLQEGFLRMDLHPPSLPAFGRDAFGPQRTYPTYRPIKLESLQSIDTTGAVSPFHGWHDGAGNLPRRTGVTARGQVKVKSFLGKWLRSGGHRVHWQMPGSRNALSSFLNRHVVRLRRSRLSAHSTYPFKGVDYMKASDQPGMDWCVVKRWNISPRKSCGYSNE